MLSGELAGRALPGSCLHVRSSAELSESFLQPEGPPVPFPVAGLCSLPIHVVWGSHSQALLWAVQTREQDGRCDTLRALLEPVLHRDVTCRRCVGGDSSLLHR